MSNAQRAGLIAIAAIVAIAAFLVLRPEDEDSSEPASRTTAPPTTITTPTNTGPTAPPEPPEPEFTRIRVRDGKPVGGVEKIEAEKDETVRFEVTADAEHEVHLHGYDVSKDVAPGRRARFVVKARIEGIFEIELEEIHEQIAELEVRP